MVVVGVSRRVGPPSTELDGVARMRTPSSKEVDGEARDPPSMTTLVLVLVGGCRGRADMVLLSYSRVARMLYTLKNLKHVVFRGHFMQWVEIDSRG